ncbi:MAG: N-acetylornithine carbamoyltransferase [Phycisphaerae bacterium]
MNPNADPRSLFISFFDHDPERLAAIIDFAARLKAHDGPALERARAHISDRILGMVFFNPSLRTRTSFEAAMLRFGGHAICLNVGGDTWQLEHRDGVVMNEGAAEHIREAAPVLSRYCDALAVRTFAQLKSAAEDEQDALMRAFAAQATVPLINMESATEHPCQALADWLTVRERCGTTARRRFTLTWAPQAKAVPMAVPNSAVLMSAAAGMQLTIAHPPGYDLSPRVLDETRRLAAQTGGSVELTHDQRAACRDAEVVYVKSWGAAQLYGKPGEQNASFAQHADWMVTPAHLATDRTILMHCLPVRRNVVIADAALDDRRCVVVDQAENRLWAQAAVLAEVLR